MKRKKVLVCNVPILLEPYSNHPAKVVEFAFAFFVKHLASPQTGKVYIWRASLHAGRRQLVSLLFGCVCRGLATTS